MCNNCSECTMYTQCLFHKLTPMVDVLLAICPPPYASPMPLVNTYQPPMSSPRGH